MPKKRQSFDLYTFVAGAAIETGKPFVVECNCGGTVTIMPPFQDEFVVCPQCESTIRMLVLEGDPGYVIGQGADGNPTLLPVQGSTKPHPSLLPEKERNEILAKVKENLSKRASSNGKP